MSATHRAPGAADSAWIRPLGSGGGTRVTTLAEAASTDSSDPRAVPTQILSRPATTAIGPSGTGTRAVTWLRRPSTRSSIPAGRAPCSSAQQVTQTVSPTAATPTGPYSTLPSRTRPITRLVARSTRHSSSDRSSGTQAVSADTATAPRSAEGRPIGTLATIRWVEGSIRSRRRSATTHRLPASSTSCRGFPEILMRASTGDGGSAEPGPDAGAPSRLTAAHTAAGSTAAKKAATSTRSPRCRRTAQR